MRQQDLNNIVKSIAERDKEITRLRATLAEVREDDDQDEDCEKLYRMAVQQYKDKYICRVGEYYRVKNDPTDRFAVHHGSFDSVEDAQAFVDAMKEAGIRTNAHEAAALIDQQAAEIAELTELVEAQKQEILELHDVRDQRDEWRRRAAVLRLHVPEQIWPLFVREFPEAAQWFEEN